jgi:hypothetical protein
MPRYAARASACGSAEGAGLPGAAEAETVRAGSRLLAAPEEHPATPAARHATTLAVPSALAVQDILLATSRVDEGISSVITTPHPYFKV